MPYTLERDWGLTWVTDEDDRRATVGGVDSEIEMPLVQNQQRGSFKAKESVAVVNINDLDGKEEEEDEEKKDKYVEGDERTDNIAVPTPRDREETPGGDNDNNNTSTKPTPGGSSDIGRVNVHESLKAEDPKDTSTAISAQASVHSEVTVVDMSMFGDD